MRRSSVQLLSAALVFCAFIAGSVRADVLFDSTNLIGLPTVATPSQYSFTATSAQALTVTLTDFQTPAAFSSLQIAVTLGDTIVVSGSVDGTHTATVAVPAAAGNYTLRVIGTPDATLGYGSFGVCVAPAATPTACIAADSFSGSLTTPSAPSSNTTSTLDSNFTATTAGNYTVTLTDDMFPVALSSALPPSGFVFSGGTPVGSSIPFGTPTTLSLTGGQSYDLKVVAVADQTVQAGLYGVQVTDPSGAVVFGRTVPVGGVGSATVVNDPGAQPLTLTLTDFEYPAALTSLEAAVTSGGAAALGVLAAAGSDANIAAPAGTLDVWTFTAAGAQPGVYSLTLAGGAGKLLSTTEVVNPPTSAASTSYAFVVNLPSAGMYQLIATDFQFPTSLASLSATVAQNGTVLTQDSSGDFTGSAGEAVVVVNAQPPTSGNGVFAVTVQSVPAQTNGTATTYLDQTQAVGGTFTTQVVTVGASGGYVVTLNDLGFPSNFQNLAVILSQGSQVFGKIYNSGSFPVSVTPGTYVLTFVATPGAENYGLYAINIASQPPTVTFTAGITSVTAGQPVQLTWSSQNATSCTASGATNWTGTETLSGTTALVVNATETLTLTCAGPGGSTPESVSVTATAAPPTGKGGGGSLDIGLLAVLAVVFACRFQTRLRGRACA